MQNEKLLAEKGDRRTRLVPYLSELCTRRIPSSFLTTPTRIVRLLNNTEDLRTPCNHATNVSVISLPRLHELVEAAELAQDMATCGVIRRIAPRTASQSQYSVAL